MQQASQCIQVGNTSKDLYDCLAYQTPPYEISKRSNCSIPQPFIPSWSPSSSEVLIGQIALFLSRLTDCYSTSKIKNESERVKCFLKEVMQRSKSNKKSALLATIYFERIYDAQHDVKHLPEFAHCSKRIFLCCLMLANKFLNDNAFGLNTWHLISGLKKKDLSFMERWCLSKLSYRLVTKEEDMINLEKHLAMSEKKRAYEDDQDDQHRRVYKRRTNTKDSVSLRT